MKGERGRPRQKEPIIRYPEFQKNLQSTMERLGITRAEIAKKLGMTDGTFGHYWNGERIPVDPKIQGAICEMLNVTWDWLTRGVSLEKKTIPSEAIKEIRMIQIPVEDLKDIKAIANLWEKLKKYYPD